MCVLGLRILSSRGSELSSIILDLERWLIYQTMGFSGRRIHFRSQIEDQERGGGIHPLFTNFNNIRLRKMVDIPNYGFLGHRIHSKSQIDYKGRTFFSHEFYYF